MSHTIPCHVFQSLLSPFCFGAFHGCQSTFLFPLASSISSHFSLFTYSVHIPSPSNLSFKENPLSKPFSFFTFRFQSFNNMVWLSWAYECTNPSWPKRKSLYVLFIHQDSRVVVGGSGGESSLLFETPSLSLFIYQGTIFCLCSFYVFGFWLISKLS